MKDDRPQALYRFFDAADDLLYVGRTANPGARWKKHAGDKLWWSELATVRVQHFTGLAAVDAAERTAIRTEHPRYNVVHAQPRTEPVLTAANAVDTADEAVALGLRDGRCPVGIIRSWTDERVELSLYSFLSGEFGYQRASYSTTDVDEVRYTRVLTPHEMRKRGYRAPEDPIAFARVLAEDGGPVWEMDSLAQFQARWQHRHGLVTDEELTSTLKIFTGV